MGSSPIGGIYEMDNTEIKQITTDRNFHTDIERYLFRLAQKWKARAVKSGGIEWRKLLQEDSELEGSISNGK